MSPTQTSRHVALMPNALSPDAARHRFLFDQRLESTMVSQFVSADEVLERIRADYLEMPGLRVSTAQARRLWGLEPVVCDRALGMLQERQFLKRLTDGTFVRVHSR